MGFLSGRVSFVRYRVGGASPLPFSEADVEAVAQHAIGRHGPADPTDGVRVGWNGGRHVLDQTFDFGKNVLDDALHVGIRLDSDKVPAELLRAYTQIELDARAAESPTGRPTKQQREEAKEAARVRADAEAADGRFRKRKSHPILWDGRTSTLYAGTTSTAVLDRLATLFRTTFDRPLEPITAGTLAQDRAAALGRAHDLEALAPLALFEDSTPQAVWAESEPTRRDDLGNEFLLWLWHSLQADGDAVTLADGSEVTVMMAKTLTLDCPRGLTGRDSLTNEGPTRLPEAFRALQAGKLPRKVGLILVRHGEQYDLTLQAETLAVNGLALPKPEGLSGDEAKVARIESLRHVTETLDSLFDAFIRRRIDPGWDRELGRIRDWLRAA